MEYIYAAMLLHKSGKDVNEDNVTSVLEAADIDVEESRVKAMIAALEDVDIEDAIESADITTGGSAPASTESADEDEGSEEEDDSEEESSDEEAEEGDEEDAAEGLGNLF